MMRPISIVVLVVLLSFLFLLFFSIAWQPFATEITQDRLAMRKLCEWQIGCGSVVGPYSCRDDTTTEKFRKLSRWSGFHGCNNATKGFNPEDGRIILEYCSCGGLM